MSSPEIEYDHIWNDQLKDLATTPDQTAPEPSSAPEPEK